MGSRVQPTETSNTVVEVNGSGVDTKGSLDITSKLDVVVQQRISRLAASRARTDCSNRVCRLISYFVVLLLALAVWSTATMFNETWSADKSYDVSGELTLTVSGCDVHFASGDSPSIRYAAKGRLYQADFSYEAADSSVVRSAALSNSLNSCSDVPHEDCGLLCLVTIVVPASSTATFHVYQDTADLLTRPKLVVGAGVALARLSVGYWSSVAPTLSVVLRPTAAVGVLNVDLHSGSLTSQGATLGAIGANVRGPGSIYILDVDARAPGFPDALSLSWRQPSNRVCVASDDADDAVEAAPPWQDCDVASVLDGSSSDDYLLHYFVRTQYDRNGDYRVTGAEFTAGMAELTCCGGDAPFNCWCESQGYRAFPPVDDRYHDRFDVTLQQFVANLVALNETRLVGKKGAGGCKQQLQWRRASSEAASSEQASGTTTTTALASSSSVHNLGSLWSDGGEVVVTLRSSGNASAPYHAAYRTPATGKADGYRLAEADAARLMATYGAQYGDRGGGGGGGGSGGSGDIFLSIDVEGSPGVPRSRWVYVTRPAYLILHPALLSLVSGGVLLPHVRRERVTLLNNDCAALEGLHHPSSGAAYDAAVRQTHRQLSRALHSSGADAGPLRGELVLLHEHSTWGAWRHFPTGSASSSSATSDGDENVHLVEWDNAWLRAMLTAAAAVSLALGALLGMVGCGVCMGLATSLQRRQRREAVARWRVVLLRQGIGSRAATQQAEHAVAASGGGDDADGFFVGLLAPRGGRLAWLASSPLCDPFGLISSVAVEPLRRRMINSLRSFVLNRMEVLPVAQRRMGEARAAPLLGSSVDNRSSAAQEMEAEVVRSGSGGGGGGGGGGEPFVFMRDLQRSYEAFCLVHKLAYEPSRAVLQRRLVLQFGCTVRSLQVRRLRGAVWRDRLASPPDPATRGAREPRRAASSTAQHAAQHAAQQTNTTTTTISAPPPESPPTPRGGPHGHASDIARPEVGSEGERLLLQAERDATAANGRPKASSKSSRGGGRRRARAFFDAHCVATGMKADHIDIEDRLGPDGAAVRGLRPEMYAWCRSLGLRPPSLRGREWAELLPPKVRFYDGQRVRQVYGLKWLRGSGSATKKTTSSSSSGGDGADGGGDFWASSSDAEGEEHGEQHEHELGWSFASLFAVDRLFGPEGMRILATELLTHFLAVLLHALLMLGPALGLTLYGLEAQQLWALTLAPPHHGTYGDSPEGAAPLPLPPLLSSDVLQPSPNIGTDGRRATLPMFAALALESVLFACVAALRLLLYYAKLNLRPERSCAHRLAAVAQHGVTLVFGGCLFAHSLLLLVLVGVLVSWLLLAAALDPVRFLSYGAAVLTVLIVGWTIHGEFSAAAAAFRAKLARAFNRMLSRKLRRARARIELEAYEALVRESDAVREGAEGHHLAGLDEEDEDGADEALREALATGGAGSALNGGGDGGADGSGAAGEKVVTAGDIFGLLNEWGGGTGVGGDDDGKLSKAEFKRLFEVLDLSIPPAKQDRLFAAIDTDADDTVTEEEFTKGWDDLVAAMIDEEMENAGMSDVRMAMLVAAVLVLLGGVFAFIFLALSGWHTEQSFVASVRTLLVAISGRAATSMRVRLKAEKVEVDELVDELVQTQEENSHAD